MHTWYGAAQKQSHSSANVLVQPFYFLYLFLYYILCFICPFTTLYLFRFVCVSPISSFRLFMWFLDLLSNTYYMSLYDATQPSPDATTGTTGTTGSSTAAIVAATIAVFVLGMLGFVFFCQRSTNAETSDHPEFADLPEDEHPTWYAAFAPNVSPFELTHPNIWGSFSS